MRVGTIEFSALGLKESNPQHQRAIEPKNEHAQLIVRRSNGTGQQFSRPWTASMDCLGTMFAMRRRQHLNPSLTRAFNEHTNQHNFAPATPALEPNGHLCSGLHARPVHFQPVVVRDGNHGVHLRRRRRLARLLSGSFPKTKGR